MRSRLHGPDGNAERFGDLGVGETFVVAHANDGTFLVTQVLERQPDLPDTPGLFDPGRLNDSILFDSMTTSRRPRLMTVCIDRSSPGESQQPWSEGALGVIALRETKRPEKRLLGRIVCELAISQDTHAYRPNSAGVAVEHRTERIEVACCEALQRRAIQLRTRSHRSVVSHFGDRPQRSHTTTTAGTASMVREPFRGSGANSKQQRSENESKV